MLASLLAGLATGETAMALRRARSAAIAYALAALLALCGLGFLVGASYIWTAGRIGHIEAALAFGGGFILLSLIVLLIHRLSAGSRRRRAAERRKSDLTAVGIATALAALPVLLRSKGGLGVLAAPAIAMAAYAIWRENSGSSPDDPRPPEG